MDLHRRRKRSNTLQSSKKKPLALNIQNIHQWKKIGEKSNDISTVIFVKCVVVGCGLWLSWEGWCQGASHHLIVPFLFYTIGHWEWGACGDRRKAASSSQSDIKVAKRKHERYAWATLTNLWLRALPNSRELMQTPRHFCRVDLLGGWCVFCGWAKIWEFTLDDKVLVLLSLSKWKLFAKWQGPFVVMQWVRDVDYKVVHSDRGGAKHI